MPSPSQRLLFSGSAVLPSEVARGDVSASHSRAPAVERLRDDMHWIVADGAAHSFMLGIGETYLPAFALALGMHEIAAGLIATVPMVLGALLQLVSPWAVLRVGSHRRWVVICATCQALTFLPLVAMAVTGRYSDHGVFFIASLYWASGMASGPAWNSWVATLVPGRIRARYFAWRSRMAQLCLIAGLLTGGLMLQIGTALGYRLPTFALLFALAATARGISAAFLARQSEPRLASSVTQGSASSAQSRTPDRVSPLSPRWMLSYLLAVQAAVQLAGPFVNPYLLKQLGYSYERYVILLSTAYLAKVIALPALGRFACRFEARRLLVLGGIGIVPVSGLMMVSDDFSYLLGVQVVSGTFWAAYELATCLLFLEGLPPRQRTPLLTVYNLGHALATATGAIAGGALLSWLGQSAASYGTLFALSTLARAATLPLLSRATARRAHPAGESRVTEARHVHQPGTDGIAAPRPGAETSRIRGLRHQGSRWAA